MAIPPEKARAVEIVDQISKLYEQLQDAVRIDRPLKSRMAYGSVANELHQSKYHTKRLRYWIVKERDME